MSRFLFLPLLLVLGAFPAHAQFAPVSPEQAGMSTERLDRLDHLIESYVADQSVAGAVMLVLRDGKAVRFDAYGQRDREAGTPMTTDTIFRIASMSKAVTSVAVMMLYEEGHFLLDDPIQRYIPAFADMQVAVPAPEGSADSYVLEPARRPITIHHLLTHTAGLTYGDGLARDRYEAADLTGWYFADKEETIGEAINHLATLPLHGHPGEQWQYGY
jgi:CubicO group peptidase (beta-lactamase class C family)